MLGADLLKPFQMFTARVECLLRAVGNFEDSYGDHFGFPAAFPDCRMVRYEFSDMPELTWRYGYLYVMFLCTLVLGLCFLYMRKKKL